MPVPVHRPLASLTATEVRSLIETSSSPAASFEERRASPRIPCDLRMLASVVHADDTIGPCSEGRVIEVSHGGCGFLIDEPIAIGTLMVIQAFAVDGSSHQCLYGEVRHGRPCGAFFVVGLQFLPPPMSGAVYRWLAERSPGAA